MTNEATKGWGARGGAHPIFFAGVLLAPLLPVACGDPAPPPADPAPAATSRVETVPLDPRVQDEIVTLIAQGKYDEARRRIEVLLVRTPNDGRAVFLLGLTHHRQRRYAAALPHFERAVELAPDHDVVHHFLGYCRFYAGDLDGARDAFERHIAADPDEADSHFGLGLVELEDGRFDEAEVRFNRAIELTERLRETDPAAFSRRRRDLAKFHARLGDVHLTRNDPAAARDALITAVEIDPGLYAAWFRLSTVHRRLGDEAAAAEALRVFEEAKSNR
ncbi:MAG: tetratricopeptide repeat protein [Planctomycetes bacterium]|nr:tetratricopeptide repeat protein [Planctomycetota bacterium]